ncbi:MAG: phenylacetate-CoA oxygenase subunit PaaI [Cyanobacteria bacterium SZAS LIN-2]|nr:phenylacetate-CoA oxygenase subunit PaaI [Cyanobacteria bacterium SZAS LIN-2]
MTAHILNTQLTDEDNQLIERIACGALVENWSETSGRYKELATGIILQFADSQMAGAAGFVPFINKGPMIQDRIDLSRLVTEKMSMAKDAYAVLSGLNFNSQRYVSGHCFDSRVSRDSFLGFSRSSADKRLNALLYPLESFDDMIVFTYLLAVMAKLMLKEFSEASLKPLRDLATDCLAIESSHADLALTALSQRVKLPASKKQIDLSLHYWFARIETSAGPSQSLHNEWHRKFGLKRSDNAVLRDLWLKEILEQLRKLGLEFAPPESRSA